MKKLSLSLLSFLLVSIIALGWAADLLFDYFIDNNESTPLAHYETLGKQLAFTLNQQETPDSFVQQWQRSNADNTLALMAEQNLPLPEDLWLPLKNGEPLTLESDNGLTLFFWLDHHEKLLAFSPAEFQYTRDDSTLRMVLTTGYYILLLALLGLWLLPLLRSLQALRHNARAYGRGDFSARIQPKGISYIDEIEHTFNKMADQIETLINDNKLISSAVSHDLRTPLARLRFGIDILSETEEPKERAKYQEHLSNDIDEMQSLVEALLNYAKLDQNLISLEKEPVDVLAVLNTFRESHPDNVVSLEHHTPENTRILGHATYLKMLLHNVLNNALQHGDKAILVTTGINKQHLVISIHDDGTGVNETDRENVFQPFVRGESLKKHQGFGMGLAIAKRIAQWHDGDIEIYDSNRLSGAEFLIRLPIHKST
jgi:two-component system OmpR family sensor kinase